MAQKKDRRKAYLNAYRQNENGTYVYCGNLHTYQGDAKSLRLLKTELGICGAALFALLLAAGFLQTSGVGRCMYVMLPYAAALCGSISVCWGIFRFCTGPASLPAHICEAFLKKLPGHALFTACCCIISLAGLILYLAFNGLPAASGGFFFFPLLNAAALTAALRIRFLVRSTEWKEESRR